MKKFIKYKAFAALSIVAAIAVSVILPSGYSPVSYGKALDVDMSEVSAQVYRGEGYELDVNNNSSESDKLSVYFEQENQPETESDALEEVSEENKENNTSDRDRTTADSKKNDRQNPGEETARTSEDNKNKIEQQKPGGGAASAGESGKGKVERPRKNGYDDDGKPGNNNKPGKPGTPSGGNEPSKPDVPNNPTEPEKPVDPSKLPTIRIIGLTDGQTCYNNLASFKVVARDYKLNLIHGVVFTLNGSVISSGDWKDWNGFSQGRVVHQQIEEGENHFVITATDSWGNTSSKSLTVYGDSGSSGGRPAKIFLSLDLRSINCGFKFQDFEVEINEDEPAINPIVRGLAQAGYTAHVRGDMYGAYIYAISGEGIAEGWDLTQEEIDAVEAKGITVWMTEDEDGNMVLDRERQDINCLREFDITFGSGWLWYLNGKKPNAGTSSLTVLDGDEISIVWTNGNFD